VSAIGRSATDWTYGQEGMAHPVEVGQVWSCAGHLFCCSDLMESDLMESVLATFAPTLVYCDPPWGQGLLNGFRTKAGLGRASYGWTDLYRRVADIGHARSLPVWIENSVIGSRDGAQTPAAITHRGFSGHDAYVEVTYYGRHRSGLYHAGVRPVPAGLLQTLAGMDDDDTPGAVMAAYGTSGAVADPCAGRGQTSREAHRVGWASVNNELNPRRVSAALARMAALTGEDVRRVVV
jgi:hypothetical protein